MRTRVFTYFCGFQLRWRIEARDRIDGNANRTHPVRLRITVQLLQIQVPVSHNLRNHKLFLSVYY